MKQDGEDGYNKLPIRITYDATLETYNMLDALPGHDNKLISEEGKLFSEFDVEMNFDRRYLVAVVLIE